MEFLRARLGDEGMITIGQVPNATGHGQRRTMDALMVQCWPSRGLSLTAVEYKASRNDWRRELRNPAKADLIAKRCHYMLMLAPRDVIPVEELPEGWGLYEIHKTPKQCRLLRTVKPVKRTDVADLDMQFLTAVLRARESYNGFDAAQEMQRQRDREAVDRRVEERVKYRLQDRNRLQEKVDEFEAASGIDIAGSWGLERLGKGLADYLKNPEQFTTTLNQQRDHLARIVRDIDQAIGK